jgi:hypothetical protein
MRRLTIRCIGLALALLLMTSAVAVAATFQGKGIEDPRVGVSFEKKRDQIKRFKVRNAKFSCTNGRRFRASMRAGDMTLDQQERFRGRFTDSEGKVAFRAEGKVAGRKAHGTTRIVAYVRNYKCSTALIEWRARAAPN